jgi:predicted Ser/Thr protein kinase
MAGELERVGPWQLTSRLGSGGMGTVYLGSNGRQLAAVKVIAPGIADEPAFRNRFRREVEICRRVSGPQVAELVDAGPNDPQPWLAVRYVPGPTLREAIVNHGPLVGETLRGFAIAVAGALHQIHAAGVVHRDLKPSNVILTAESPVIIDFGIAGVTEATSLTATGTVLGSAGWMAPEQVLGEPSGPPSDVFSWGAVVAYAATGRAPFGEGRPEALAYRIVHGEADLAGIDDDIRALISRSLSREPAERPSIEAILETINGASDTTQVAAGIAMTWVSDDATSIAQASTAPVATVFTPKARRWVPSGLGLVTTAVVLTLLGGVALFVRQQEAGPSPTDTTALSTTTETTATVGDASTTTTAQVTTTAAPTTTAPPAPPSIRTIDLRNRSYDIDCEGIGTVTTIEVTDGSWTSPQGPEYGSLNYFDATYGDATGDGIEDALINMGCSVGAGATAWGNTVVLESTIDGVNQVGQPIPSRTWLVDGELIGETPYFEDTDPRCCPSSINQSTWVLRNGGWSQEGTTRISAETSRTYAGE